MALFYSLETHPRLSTSQEETRVMMMKPCQQLDSKCHNAIMYETCSKQREENIEFLNREIWAMLRED